MLARPVLKGLVNLRGGRRTDALLERQISQGLYKTVSADRNVSLSGKREWRTTRQRRGLVSCAPAPRPHGAEAARNEAQDRAHGIHKIIDYIGGSKLLCVEHYYGWR